MWCVCVVCCSSRGRWAGATVSARASLSAGMYCRSCFQHQCKVVHLMRADTHPHKERESAESKDYPSVHHDILDPRLSTAPAPLLSFFDTTATSSFTLATSGRYHARICSSSSLSRSSPSLSALSG
ncbi:hypothetical protein K437DRAFT_150836 [Tilletiaria anomala UBC 951]|uniref:Uncharacterized protein n=1 Tax=Tilletiaria anomala (strain ATCC 24038 / CBS 436.72 / UBC 951) TaxID=1037660 RepID=A0A066WK08_TILAU|nr:uncharacterized protein K437DRAFT_150836 [Tilletiaria anomala UBC 951]KDN52888.1 hypothetical protein K437DRAFT_150836 [Tilletiaria anomala UBC 951]